VHRSLLSLALVCMSAFVTSEPGSARGDESTGLCPRCNVLVGLGTTYRFSAWTDGIVVPLSLELDESRWELGAFRFANAQRYGTTPTHSSLLGIYCHAPLAGVTPLADPAVRGIWCQTT